LADLDAVAAAYDDLADRLGPAVLVQQQVPAGVEVALGLVHDPLVGPIVMVATGGTLIEVMPQRAVTLPPVTPAAAHDLVAGQVLLAPLDFGVRSQYLHARGTLLRLLELGVVPLVNENDAIADDEIRFGDNDRLAALVAHLVGAELLVLLTDAPGVLTADPRLDGSASLIEEIVEFDQELMARAGGAGTVRGSGGMASKVSAARMASWSGIRAVIAAADREGVLVDAAAGTPGVGTVVRPKDHRLNARKLWIAFAVGSSGRIVVDDGARRALLERGVSLLPAGVVGAEGSFAADEAVEVAGPDGVVFAKGLTRYDAALLRAVAGRRTNDLPEGAAQVAIHRDDLVIVP